MNSIRIRQLNHIVENGKIAGFKVVRLDNNAVLSVKADELMKNIKSGAIQAENLRIITVNGKEYLVDQVQLNRLVNAARLQYEQYNNEIMSNRDYDAAYDTLLELERINNKVEPDSATQNVGYEVVQELPKKAHPKKMLSLDKTKSIETLKGFLGNKVGILGWKEDGLTVVLTYENGELVEAVTRGNGEVGEVVTPNARQFKNIPLRIPFKNHLVLRGEALISYKDFEAINSKIPDIDNRYKNARNLASGSVRQLDSRITAQRNVQFIAFDVVEAVGLDDRNSYEMQLNLLKSMGFDVVEHVKVNADNLDKAVKYFQDKIKQGKILPSDGLVLKYDDIKYGLSLGNTAKFPRHSIAFKWQDDTVETEIIEIEWSPSRTGLINPVAIFEPVEIDGTTVSRASVHNVQILMQLGLAPGCRVKVYKANMIIPQISENLTPSDDIYIPTECPCCGYPTVVRREPTSGVLTLYCENPECDVKGNKKFSHFVTRDAMNIDGLSESTLIKLIQNGFIENYADLYRLHDQATDIMNLPGFGYKSCVNLLNAIDRQRKVKVANLIYALGIDNVGLSTSKLIAKSCNYDLRKMVTISYNELLNIDGIGDVIADSYTSYFADTDKCAEFIDLLKELEIVPETVSNDVQMKGLTVAVHGSLYRIKRTALKDLVESKGGKLVTAVNKQTTYLVTNQPNDNTNKTRAAREHNVPIISEDEFIEKMGLNI